MIRVDLQPSLPDAGKHFRPWATGDVGDESVWDVTFAEAVHKFSCSWNQFVANITSRPRSEVLARIREKGLEIEPDSVLTAVPGIL